MNNKQLLKWNSISSLVYQLVAVLCGFVVPRLVLGRYGSETYGLVCSISSFIGIISYLDMGMSAVVQSALYAPLAKGDNVMLSRIYKSSNNFFKNIARILILYILFLVIFYPYITDSTFSHIYIGTLLIAISITSFAQYYFGITNQLLLCADQKLYIPNIIQIVTILLNTGACWLLIMLNVPVQIVYFSTSIIFLCRPLLYSIYVRKNYCIDNNIVNKEEPITQKWNGVAQHIASVVIGSTGSIVLTIFTNITNVAIYGVYYLVVSGINRFVMSATTGFQSYYGNLWAQNKVDEIRHSFKTFIWIVNTGVIFIYGCTASLIVPFVKVYTLGIEDVNYDVPLFALILTVAYACYCLRLPYNLLILACNHYKQTQKSYIVAASLNIIISVIAVYIWGLVGVALGTLIAMLYQTIWMAWYNSKELIKWPMKDFFRQISLDLVSFAVPYIISSHIVFAKITVYGWILYALEIAFIWGLWILIVNLIFCKTHLYKILKTI